MKIYVVVTGRKIGFGFEWNYVEPLVKGFPNAKHKSFKNIKDAMEYYEKY